MKLFISSDIEGTCGIAHWDETDYDRGGRWYDYFRTQMSREAAAACNGALDAGASAVMVKDAHDSARNIIPTELPRAVTIGRGWSGGIYSMVEGLQDGFDALAFTGYHAPAYSSGNPLAHTLTTAVDEITINGIRTSEFLIFSYTAALLNIPVIFLSGDAALCKLAAELIPPITAVPVNEGTGSAVRSIHPDEAVTRIREGAKTAVEAWKTAPRACLLPLPPRFEVTVRYTVHTRAFHNSQYPGARLLDEKTVGFSAESYTEVLRFFQFVL